MNITHDNVFFYAILFLFICRSCYQQGVLFLIVKVPLHPNVERSLYGEHTSTNMNKEKAHMFQVIAYITVSFN